MRLQVHLCQTVLPEHVVFQNFAQEFLDDFDARLPMRMHSHCLVCGALVPDGAVKRSYVPAFV